MILHKWMTGCVLVLCIALIFSVLLFGCLDSGSEEAIVDSSDLPPRGFFMGILPIPGEGQSLQDAYIQTAHYSEVVPVWPSSVGASGFWDYVDHLQKNWGQQMLTKHIHGNDMIPLIHFSFIDKDSNGNLILKAPETMNNATLSNPAWRALYKQSVLDVVTTCNPLYLSTGNEVNRWYAQYGMNQGDPNGFQHVITLHEEIYEMVKEVSPRTRVFCVFSREIVNEYREADLHVLSFFNPNKMDMLVLTSYPHAVQGIMKPAEIDDTYYSHVAEQMPSIPLGFSELGWPSVDAFGGEEAQAAFLTHITTRLTKDQGVRLHLLCWAWLHDLNEDDHTGLIKRDGTEKLAYQVWKNVSSS